MSKTPELVANKKIRQRVKKEDYSELLSMIQKITKKCLDLTILMKD